MRGKGYERHGSGWRVVRRVNGKKTFKSFATEQEASAFVAYVAAPSRAMTAVGAAFMGGGFKTTPTVLAYARELAETEGLRTNTKKNYRVALRKIEGTDLADMQIGNVKAPDLRAFFNRLDANRENVRAILTKTFNAAVQEDLIPKSPMRQVSRTRKQSAKVRQMRVRALTADQLEALARAAGNERDSLCIRLGGYLGLRAGEVGGLRVEDIDMPGCHIHIRRNAQRADGPGVEFGDPKTAMSERKLAVGCRLVEYIAQYIERHPPLEDGTIFYSNQRNALTHGGLTYATVRAAKRAGLYRRDEDGRQWPTFHKLRNTAASLMLMAARRPGDFKVVQEYLGHASLAMTSDLYADLFPKADQPLADAMGALMEAAERKALPPGEA